jgi:UDP-3-O-[3-hydroxymyristoyl] glucosamine N-acyltransferase
LKDTRASLIFVDNPRLWFIRCLRKYVKMTRPSGISSDALIESKKLGKNVYIGPFCHIGENVTIGDNTIIHGGVHIYGNATIGNDVIIDSCTVLGAEGFGFERNEKQQLERFPHFGGIVVDDAAEIGANVCIDRGTLEDTKIGIGSKIDNLVHIAHNVRIGMNCMIVAQSLLGGSCILEDNVFVGAGSIIKDGGVKIGRNSFIGMGAVVTKDVAESTTVIGIPAKPMTRNGTRMK